MVWLIVGGGVSGLAAAKLLRKRGQVCRISNDQTLPRERREAFLGMQVEVCDGGHQPNHLADVGHIVLSPGVSPDLPLLRQAKAAGIPITTEIDLGLAEFRGQLFAVTGTNGKSTTCAMLGHILARAGHSAAVGGNFGDPPSAMAADGRFGDYLVLELSSYQLEISQGIRPRVAVITSLSHDHLARHGNLRRYLAAKWHIFDHLAPDGLALLPDYVATEAASCGLPLPKQALIYQRGSGALAEGAFSIHNGQLITSLGDASLARLKLQEPHNQLNAALASLAASHVTKLPPATCIELLGDFVGLPHRCELVGNLSGGRPVINDSKSTNVESTLVALASLQEPAILMLGGQGKNEPYSPLLDHRAKIQAAVCFGASGQDIASYLSKEIPTSTYPTMAAALEALPELIAKYRCGVLFSPACASFDEFRNFEHRGDTFRTFVQRKLTTTLV